MEPRDGALLLLPLLLAALAQGADGPVTVADFEDEIAAKRWSASNGAEFPGATATFARSRDAARNGAWGGRLDYDFTRGGNYVALQVKLDQAPEIAGLRFWLKRQPGLDLRLRYTDQGGQTLQGTIEVPDGDGWVEIDAELGAWQGHWGGANDGKVHGAPRSLAFLVEKSKAAPGSLAIDDLRLIPGIAATPTWRYTETRFAAGEGWHGGGPGRYDAPVWTLDFTNAKEARLNGPMRSLLGTPCRLFLTVEADKPGVALRLQLRTHFMTFERAIGGLTGGVQTCEIPAPPGEGWTWHGGENDGKIHGPLRFAGLIADAGAARGKVAVKLLALEVESACPTARRAQLMADARDGVATASLRTLLPDAVPGELSWKILDWSRTVLAEGRQAITVPARGALTTVPIPLPAGGRHFAEAAITLTAPGLRTTTALAYQVAPLPDAASTAIDPASPFGMGLYLYRYGNADEMERAARMAAAAGVKWSREEFNWGMMSKRRDHIDWTHYDRVMATAGRHGISVYGLLCYWSSWTRPYTPEGIEDYCRWVGAVVERYKDRVHHWEIWNEPNIFFWQGPKEMYPVLLAKAYAAVKAADPTAEVLGCSTAGIDLPFIRTVIGLKGPMDGVTIHPYRGKLDDRGYVQELQEVAALARQPDGKERKVWITEIGWATGTGHATLAAPGVSQRAQAALVVRAYLDAIASGVVTNTCWYDYRNDGNDPAEFEDNFGLITRDFRPKPSYRAYGTMANLLAGLRCAGWVDCGPGVQALRFTGGAKPVLAIWLPGIDRDVAIPADGPRECTDLMGGTQTLQPDQGRITIPLRDGAPVFVR